MHNSFIEIDRSFITKPYEIANYFNNYFINKVDRLRNDMCTTSNKGSNDRIKKSIMNGRVCMFGFHQVMEENIEKMLLHLSDDKPPGTDNLDCRLLRIAAKYISKPLCHIFNKCLEGGVCPEIWKEAKVIPLPKDKRATFAGPNSRPISLLPVLSKILEKIVYDQIQDYLSNNKLITSCQHAYRPGHSTSTALAQMTDDWLKKMDEKRLVGTVLLDFSAAFDVIDKDLLLGKLECYGFDSVALSWMESYLSKRKQRVFFNGSFSDSKELQCGVPQGSSLGPLLFSIFTNDLPLVLNKSTVVMYADDSTMYSTASTVDELNDILNYEIKAVADWVHENKLVLNIAKTKCMVFGSRHKLEGNPQLSLSVVGKPVEQVTEAKLLGVVLDPKLNWTRQIDNIVTKMGRSIAITRKCMMYIPPKTRKAVIQALVLSHLEYCPVIWSSATKIDLHKLQIAQNKAARLALQCSNRTHIAEMHSNLSWLTVENRLHSRTLTFFRNVLFDKKPQYFLQNFVILRKILRLGAIKTKYHRYNGVSVG